MLRHLAADVVRLAARIMERSGIKSEVGYAFTQDEAEAIRFMAQLFDAAPQDRGRLKAKVEEALRHCY